MSSSNYTFNVTLYRDSLATPWGFRLEGGRDYQLPLTIQRVFTGSPASGDLQRGDIIAAIQHRDATQLLHQEANEIIRNSGGSIQLTIKRGQAYPGGGDQGQSYQGQSYQGLQMSYRPAYLSQPPVNRSAAPNYGYANQHHLPSHLFNAEDPLSNYIRSRPIEKVRDPKPILSQTGSPIMPGDTPSVSMRSSIKRYRPASTLPILQSQSKLPTTNFSSLSHSNNSGGPSGGGYAPVNTNATPVPFHDKKMFNSLQKTLSRVTYAPKPMIPAATTAYPGFNPVSSFEPARPVAPQQPPSQQSQYSFYDQPGFGNGPAWNGTLRKTGAEQQHDFHQPSAPGSPLFQRQQNKVFSHHEASDLSQPKSPLPKAVNIQYNSPIGLYSRDNINEELYKKVGQNNQNFKFTPSSEF